MSPSRKPPQWATSLVEWATAPEDRPYVLSDLEEEFERRAEESPAAARRWYRGQALRSAVAGLQGRLTWRRLRDLQRRTRPHPSRRPERRAVVRSSSLGAWGAQMVRDLRWALRTNGRRPMSLLVVTLSLGLGIGAVTSTFALLQAVLFQDPVGLEQPERLVSIYTHEPGEKTYGSSSYADVRELGERVPALDGVAAFTLRAVAFGREAAVNVLAEEVTGNYFEVTGIRPRIGRAFGAAESPMEAPSALVVLGHDFWVRRFGADPEVVGASITLDARPFTVIGIAPEGLVSRRAPLRPDLWVPLGALDGGARLERFRNRLHDHDERGFAVMGRLAPGTGRVALDAQLEATSSALAVEVPSWSRGEQSRRFLALSERESRVNPHARTLFTAVGIFLLGVTALICLIACFNVASLTMARTAARRSELALRRSLGATRARLVSMLLVEALVPTLFGVAVALATTRLVVWRLQSVELPNAFPLTLSAELNGRVLLFSLGIAMVCWLGFCLAPALRGAGLGSMAAGGRGIAAGALGSRARQTVVVLQCAAALILLVGTGLFGRSLQAAVDFDLGMRTEGVAAVSKDFSVSDLTEQVAMDRFEQIRQELAALPEVEEAAFARSVELTIAQAPLPARVSVTGRVADAVGEDAPVYRNLVSPGYLDLLDVPMVAGRRLRPGDGGGVAVVNESFAERYWPEGEALGRTFAVASADAVNEQNEFRVVGVSRDGTYIDFDDRSQPYFWTPFAHEPGRSAVFLVRGRASAKELAGLLSREVELAPGEVRRVPPSTLDEQVSIQFAHLRIASSLLGIGSVLGLFLAVIGIYGLVSLAVGERRKEMAIRMAVGAGQSQVFRAVLLDGVRAAGIGLVLGVVVAIPFARLLRSVLWGVGSADPVSFGVGAVLLTVAAVAASAVPAARLLRLDPVASLRDG